MLAVASGVAAATLAALPLTLGFFKDELFFAAALEDGASVQVLAVLAAALTFAYIGRFWLGAVHRRRGGPSRTPIPRAARRARRGARRSSRGVGGIVVEPFAGPGRATPRRSRTARRSRSTPPTTSTRARRT